MKNKKYIREIFLGLTVLVVIILISTEFILFINSNAAAPISSGLFSLLTAFKILILGIILFGYIYHIVHYIKEKKQTSLGEFTAILDKMPGGLICCNTDNDYTLLFYNQGFLDLTGFSADEIRLTFNNKLISIIYPNDRDKVLKATASRKSQSYELQYRIIKKDGSVIFVSEYVHIIDNDNGIPVYYCNMYDITELERTREKLKQSLTDQALRKEMFSILAEQTTGIVFEYNIFTHKITHSSRYRKTFGYSAITDNFPASILDAELIHPEDISAFIQFYKSIENGESYVEGEHRIRHVDGEYIWCNVHATTIFNSDGIPTNAVGLITDISQKKNACCLSRAKNQLDVLTGLYNKTSTRKEISSLLFEYKDSKHTMFIINIDNFHRVNDNWGHEIADTVLVDLSPKLQKLFRSSDVIGRINGDEFIVLLKDSTPSLVLSKAAEISSIISSIGVGDGGYDRITCSIGIADYPNDGITYEDLKIAASQALRYAKSCGKNQCISYKTLNAASNKSAN